MFVAWRDLKFAKGRFGLMGSVIVLITLLVGLLSGLTAGLGRENTSAITGLPADLIAFGAPGGGGGLSYADSAVTERQWRQWAGAPGVESAEPLGITMTRAAAGDRSGGVSVFGVRPGSHLAPEGALLGGGAAVLSAPAADELGVRPGDAFTLAGHRLTVAAVRGDAYFSHTPVVWTGLDLWRRIAPPSGPDASTATAPGTGGDGGPVGAAGAPGGGGTGPDVDVRAAAPGATGGAAGGTAAGAGDSVSGGAGGGGATATVIALTTASGTDVAGTDRRAGTRTVTVGDSLSAIGSYTSENGSLQLMRGFLFAISALVIGAFFTVWTIQRAGDVAVLKALGASTGTLMRDALGQAAVLLVGGTLIGTGLAAALGALVSGSAVPFLLTPATVLVPAAVMILLGVLGAALAVRRITAVDPLTALGSAR
ncbi:ABC transporter permease [Streptomyces sp. SHP 1-2]|uniref:ABC transporter permease n=1 Tax=Streptomyces sp. SHP 1-2 TaxID=2769489 RepID=UPI00223836CB|nr:ABC transporter permease [Streptomyces sp. SHP 1-2]MCW5249825.1 ABC transporter permease [Streptomyces sp. SHP 1-2]